MNEVPSPALFWQPNDHGAICQICHDPCLIPEGGFGRCSLRQNQLGKMTLPFFGKPAHVSLTTVEKLPLFHFHPNATVLLFSVLPSPFRCDGVSKEEGLCVLPDALVLAASAYHASALAFKDDPMFCLEYTMEAAENCRMQGLLTIAHTTAFFQAESAHAFFARMDAVCVSLPLFSSLKEAQTLASLPHLIWAREKTACHLEIQSDLSELSKLETPEDLFAFTAAWITRYLGRSTPWHLACENLSPHLLISLKNIAKQEGLSHVYFKHKSGLLSDSFSSFCPQCEALLIERNERGVLSNDLLALKHCPHCQTPIVGYFNEIRPLRKAIPRFRVDFVRRGHA